MATLENLEVAISVNISSVRNDFVVKMRCRLRRQSLHPKTRRCFRRRSSLIRWNSIEAPRRTPDAYR